MLLGDRGVSTHTPFAFGVAATIIEPINVKGFLKRQKKQQKATACTVVAVLPFKYFCVSVH